MPIALRIGERQPGRSILATDSRVDVCRCLGRRLVLASEANELDGVADEVEVTVDAEIVKALNAIQTASGDWIVGAIDDLVRRGFDVVGRCEREDGVGVTIR